MDLGLNKPFGGVFGGPDGPVWDKGPVVIGAGRDALAELVDRPHWRQPGTTSTKDVNKLTFYRDALKPQVIPQFTSVFMFRHKTYDGFKCVWSVGAGNRLPAGVSLDADTGTLRYARADNPQNAASPRTGYAIHAIFRSTDGRHAGHWTAQVRIEVKAGDSGGDGGEDAGSGDPAPEAGRPTENNSLGLKVYRGLAGSTTLEPTTDAEARELMAAYPKDGLVIKANTLHPSVQLATLPRAHTSNFGDLVSLAVSPVDLPASEFRVHSSTGEVVYFDEQANATKTGEHTYQLSVVEHYAVAGSASEVFKVTYTVPLRVAYDVDKKAVPADVASPDGKTSDGEGATLTQHGAHLAWWVWLLGSIGAVLVVALIVWAVRRRVT